MLQGASDPRPGSGLWTNKHERFYIKQRQNKRDPSPNSVEEERAVEKREMLEGNHSRFCGASCPVYIPGEVVPAEIRISQNLMLLKE
jgi:hypothetical protein